MLLSYLAYTEAVQVVAVLAFGLIVSIWLIVHSINRNARREYKQFQQRMVDNAAQREHEKSMQSKSRRCK